MYKQFYFINKINLGILSPGVIEVLLIVMLFFHRYINFLHDRMSVRVLVVVMRNMNFYVSTEKARNFVHRKAKTISGDLKVLKKIQAKFEFKRFCNLSSGIFTIFLTHLQFLFLVF